MKTKIISYNNKKIEICIEDKQKGRSFDKIKTPKRWKLWTHQMCIDLHNDKGLRKILNLELCSFWIAQFFEFNKENGRVAWFLVCPGGVGFSCFEVPQYSLDGLGVRFWREVK